MYFLSTQASKITDEKMTLVQVQKYIQASKQLAGYLAEGDLVSLKQMAKKLNYKNVNINLNDKNIKILYKKRDSFDYIKVLQNKNGYFLYIKHLGNSFVFYDKTQIKESEQKEFFNDLIAIDILILLFIFIILIRILRPLRDISQAIEKFGEGDYSKRLKESKRSDEIAIVINRFNQMAQNLDTLIKSRTQLLSDISHELRTPIAKSKLALEMLKSDDKYTDILKRAINQIDTLTNELLEAERLNSQSVKMEMKRHSIDSVLAEALSKMMIDDEEQIELEIIRTFECKSDINYLSIAIKNLIDNALKYKEKGKVKITINQGILEIADQGSPLKKELTYYLETFTQDDNSRNVKGYGLGLNIVKRVLEYHNFELKYRYENRCNIFSIIFH